MAAILQSPIALYMALIAPFGSRIWAAYMVERGFGRRVSLPEHPRRGIVPPLQDLRVEIIGAAAASLLAWLTVLSATDTVSALVPGGTFFLVAGISFVVSFGWALVQLRRIERRVIHTTRSATPAGLEPHSPDARALISPPLILVGAALYGISPFLPWLSLAGISTGTAGTIVDVWGFESVDGYVALGIAILLAGLVVMGVLRGWPRSNLTWVRRLSTIAVWIAMLELSRTAFGIVQTGEPIRTHVAVGAGLIVLNLGGIVAGVASRRRTNPGRELAHRS